jgi:hypothetical protein
MRQRFAWAVSIILSRTWGRKGRHVVSAEKGAGTRPTEGTQHALTPAADFPNHVNSAAEAGRDPRGTLVLKTLENASATQQLFISYGAKCDAEFLAHYG